MKRSIFSILFFLILLSCGPNLQFHSLLEQQLAANDYQAAYRLVKNNKHQYKNINQVLFYADMGLLTHYAGMYRESIENLFEAERLVEELFTTSVSRQAATLVVNDYMAPYKGEDFESVMFNLLLALNFLKEGEIEDALVEARKVDAKLNLINSYYPDDKQNVYKEDAFVRFLMGIIYEMGGTQEDLNDAYVSYKRAAEIYAKDYRVNYQMSVPPLLLSNLLSIVPLMGTDELHDYTKRYPAVEMVTTSEKQEKGELYFLHYNGKSPEKVEHAIWARMPDGYIMKIAFPKYRSRPFRIRSSMVKVTNVRTGMTTTIETELGENIAAIAAENLENRRTRILAKAIARATAKYLAVKKGAEKLKEEYGKDTGKYGEVIGNIVAVATENADLRCWKTLPAEIRIARCLLDPGTYTVELFFEDQTGQTIGQLSLGQKSVQKKEKQFVFFHTID
ncbi:COG3014 family protein [Thermodesulfobacteriota bacterium]